MCTCLVSWKWDLLNKIHSETDDKFDKFIISLTSCVSAEKAAAKTTHDNKTAIEVFMATNLNFN